MNVFHNDVLFLIKLKWILNSLMCGLFSSHLPRTVSLAFVWQVPTWQEYSPLSSFLSSWMISDNDFPLCRISYLSLAVTTALFFLHTGVTTWLETTQCRDPSLLSSATTSSRARRNTGGRSDGQKWVDKMSQRDFMIISVTYENIIDNIYDKIHIINCIIHETLY